MHDEDRGGCQWWSVVELRLVQLPERAIGAGKKSSLPQRKVVSHFPACGFWARSRSVGGCRHGSLRRGIRHLCCRLPRPLQKTPCRAQHWLQLGQERGAMCCCTSVRGFLESGRKRSRPRAEQPFFSPKVSSWTLAREVNRAGELGVISGTAMETVLIR
jgi:hypothetical protein